MQWHQIFTKVLREQQNGTFVASQHVMLSSKFISNMLLKCLHLETSSYLLFRRFIPWCVAISNFSFKQRLHLRHYGKFIRWNIRTISQTRKYITVHSQRIQSPSKYYQTNSNYIRNANFKPLIKRDSFLSCSKILWEDTQKIRL